MHKKPRLRPLCAAIAALPFPLFFSPALHAQTAETQLKEIVVSATRIEQSADDVAATISSVTQKQVEREMPVNLQEMMRYENGVSVRVLPNRASGVFSATGRAGNEGVNIRGLEGDQVRLQVDGVRLPSTYSSGPYAAGRGDYIDVEAYKRVEILRGPSSTQFGSDGLAGAVSFLTKDPADLLTLGKPTQFAFKSGYNSVDRSWSLVPSFAIRGDTVEAMVLASLRRGHETKTGGSNDSANINRTTANPADTSSDYVLAKMVIKKDRNNRFKLTAENLDRENSTTPLSFFGDSFAAAGLNDVKTRENITRQLLKLDYDYTNTDNSWFQSVSASIYGQHSKNHQWGYEARSITSGWNSRTRDTEYGEKVAGGNLQLESNFGNAVAHRLIYGVDASLTKVESLKEGNNMRDGVSLTGTAGFKVNKSFPDTDYRLLGAFIQDEISIDNLAIIPGLRYDSFKLTPKPDALYAVNNSIAPTTLSGNELSPKLGVIWKFSPVLNAFAQYAHGFRAPTPGQVNGGVTNLTANPPYTAIGNADLKPEISDSLEFGLRGRTQEFSYSASIFHGKYKNFIASNVQVGGVGTLASPTVFQSVNLSDVKINGFEARGEWNFSPNWMLSASYAHARGDQNSNGKSTPLETIDPDKLVLSLRYNEERYGAQANLSAAERKKRNPYGASSFSPGSYQVLDLMVWYNIDKNSSINAGVFNLLNQKYFLWADVRGVSANSASLDAYSQAGRNFSVSYRYQF